MLVRKWRKGNLYIVDGDVNWNSHCGKQYGDSSKKLKKELPYDPAISLLGIYPKEMRSVPWRNSCTPMFIATLFKIAKTWKQAKCLLTNEWIKKMCYIHIYNGLLAIKKELNNVICNNMDGPRDYHTKWSKPDRERQISYDIDFMWNPKKTHKWTYLQGRNRPTDIDNKLMVTKGERRGGIN